MSQGLLVEHLSNAISKALSLPERYAAHQRRLHWLRRENARLADGLAVERAREAEGRKPPPGAPTISSLVSNKAMVERQLRETLGRLGRVLSHRPLQASLEWRDYPTEEDDMLPTLLGCRIRAFERYANARFGLDILVLWYDFVGVAEERVHEGLASARQGVEIFLAASVSFVGLSVASLIPLGWSRTWQGAWWILLLTAAGSAMVSVVTYRKAIAEVDEWASAISGLVNTHRVKVATAMGLVLPDKLADEQRMWRAVTGFVRTGSEAWAKRLDAFPRLPQRPDGD